MRLVYFIFALACRDREADSGAASPVASPSGGLWTVEDLPSTPGTVGTPALALDWPEDALRVAMIGDYGDAGDDAAAVAEIVAHFAPDAVLTMGDNNYPAGATSTIDENIGQYYASFIHPYAGAYGAGGLENRFWPCLGNHDWDLGTVDAYTDWFELPGNERYYSVDLGALQVFCVDSDPREPDGTRSTSVQADWLRAGLAAASAPWTLVTLHHPPYSSGSHGDNAWMAWPFGAWGADMVWAGHDHDYQRMHRQGVVFGVSGIGGTSLRAITRDPAPGSSVAWFAGHGATLAAFTDEVARVRTVSVGGVVVDDFLVPAGRGLAPTRALVHERSDWRYFASTLPPDAAWTQPGFDDAGWAAGQGPLGFGRGDEGTVLHPGSGGPVTTWFRHTFTAPHLEGWDGLDLELRVEDGAIAWLNGVEVARIHLPDGEVTSRTLATRDPSSRTAVPVRLPQSAVVEGENVLAVEVHLAAPGATALGLDATLDLRQDDRLVAFGALWRYHDAGTAPSEGWAEAAFDDAAWAVGAAPFGYGAAVSTEIDVGGDPADRPATTWYRHAFEVEEAAAVDALLLELVRADAAVVWLNGAEVLRLGLPEGDLAASAYAPTSVIDGWAALPVRTFVDPIHLVDGVNVVAAAIRVARPDRSLHRFDLALVPFP